MLQYILNRFEIDTNHSIAVGDGENDICMIKLAGKGVSFNSTNPLLDNQADYIFRNESLTPVLDIAK